MLDPWIIEEILKKEEQRRNDLERGRVDVPVDTYREDHEPKVTPAREETERGVMIIDI
jgi:hypothetical protein